MISDVSVEEIPEIPKRLPIKHKKSKNKRISAQKFSNLDSLKEMTLNTRSGKFSEGKTVCLIKARLNEINRNQKNNIHTRKPIIYDSEEIIEFVWRDPVKTFRTSSPNPRRLGFV